MSCKLVKIIYRKEPKITKYDKKNGMSVVQPDGHLKLSKRRFINDKLNGKAISYYEDGYIQRIFYNTNGKINGDFIMYYDNGNMECKGYYIDDKLNGEEIWYYLNGCMGKKYYTIDNMINGFRFYYDKDNKLIRKTYSINGVCLWEEHKTEHKT